MDNIQLYHIDNEINKVDEMKEGDVIYKNGVELLVVLSYDHNEPCKGCLLNDFIIYINNNGSIDEEDYDLLLTK